MEMHPAVQLNLRLDTNIIFCKEEEATLKLFESYAIKRGPVITRQIGQWNSSSGLQITSPVLWERRSDLMRTQLTDNILPYSIVTQFDLNEEGEIIKQRGILQDLFTTLQSRLNFTAKAVSPPDGKWGNVKDDGTWSGMIGELINHRTDICTSGWQFNWIF